MLQVAKRSLTSFGNDDSSDQISPADALLSYVSIVRRQLWLIVLVVGCAVTLALVYLVTTPPSYTATAMMVIDTRKVQLFEQQSLLSNIAVDAGTVETQIQILQSENVSLAVINDLHLIDDPEFTGGGDGIIGAVTSTISGFFSPQGEASEFERTRSALAVFERNRTIAREGLTYVMKISFRSRDAEKASRIANAIANAYVLDQLEAKYQMTRRASIWLQDRMKKLRRQATMAERAVVDFREKHNIVDTGGRLMNQQQLAELNSALILARTARAEAQARLERINQIMQQDVPDASVTDALRNDVIVRLRGQYLDLATREADFSKRFGKSHEAVLGLKNQMAEIKTAIRSELGRIAESYRSDYDIAGKREESLQSSLDKIVTQSQLTSQAQLGLRELQSNAQTYRAMHDDFLQRYMEAVQQESFPITEARVISAASRPQIRSHPRHATVLAGAIAGGLFLGFGIALMRELTDNTFRTGGQVERILQTTCLATLPALGSRAVRRASRSDAKIDIPRAGPRLLAQDAGLLRYVIAAPFSRFTESIRAIKVATNIKLGQTRHKVIGVTSSVANEGKSTIAANLAHLLAHAGDRVLLIDSDLRNSSLSRGVAGGSALGLVDIIGGEKSLEDLVWHDPVTRLDFLPAGDTEALIHTSDILGSEAMLGLITRLRDIYDYIVVDLPPLAPVVDVRMTVNFIDAYTYVIEWGKTASEIVVNNLAGADDVYSRVLGVVLNKADTQVLSRYEGYQSGYYNKKYYGRYVHAD